MTNGVVIGHHAVVFLNFIAANKHASDGEVSDDQALAAARLRTRSTTEPTVLKSDASSLAL
jgi:hypothetical protein